MENTAHDVDTYARMVKIYHRLGLLEYEKVRKALLIEWGKERFDEASYQYECGYVSYHDSKEDARG